MQNTTRLAKTIRTTCLTGSLLAAMAFGSVAANSNDVGLTECDHGCKVATLLGNGNSVADFQIIDVAQLDPSTYVSSGFGDIGFTR